MGGSIKAIIDKKLIITVKIAGYVFKPVIEASNFGITICG